MGRIHDTSNRTTRMLKTGRAPPRSRQSAARRRGIYLEEALAAASTDAIRGLDDKATGGPFLLVDVAGRHFWDGAAWLPFAGQPWPLDCFMTFSTREEAEAEVRRLRRQKRRVRVIALPPWWH